MSAQRGRRTAIATLHSVADLDAIDSRARERPDLGAGAILDHHDRVTAHSLVAADYRRNDLG